MSDLFDLIVVGGGPGGYVAALRASQLGMNVALVESTHMGGVCLNWGCIPTKALLRSAEVYHSLGHLKKYGLSASNPSFDLEAIVKRSRSVAEGMGKGVAHLLKKAKVKTFDGHAKLAGREGEAHKVSITKNGKET
ncbi:MAG: FAD-dependent oxidoreductase, partial [Bifidobacteriales bacterium]|nr:FAD-dependent oxidoreductase [Bifidobacteriales bacterium]